MRPKVGRAVLAFPQRGRASCAQSKIPDAKGYNPSRKVEAYLQFDSKADVAKTLN